VARLQTIQLVVDWLVKLLRSCRYHIDGGSTWFTDPTAKPIVFLQSCASQKVEHCATSRAAELRFGAFVDQASRNDKATMRTTDDGTHDAHLTHPSAGRLPGSSRGLRL